MGHGFLGFYLIKWNTDLKGFSWSAKIELEKTIDTEKCH
jgi:hypothetical protein